MTEIISREKLESALMLLAETDDEFANEKAQLERSAILCKRVRARIFLTSTGTVAERQAQAEISADAEQADDDYCKTIALFESLKARRERAEIIVRVFQTLEATRRSKL